MNPLITNSPHRSLFSALGGVVALLQPTIPFIILCTVMVLGDVYTAYSLSRRVKRKYPNSSDGKFKSIYFGRIIKAKLYQKFKAKELKFEYYVFCLEFNPIRHDLYMYVVNMF